MAELKGRVFNIQRYSVNDGTGIRTLVFMKGCPLNCVWCANPEGIRFEKTLSFLTRKCIGCGKCIPACPQNAISAADGTIQWDKEKCVECMACVKVCYAQAREVLGTDYTVDELMAIIEKDRAFYRRTGGGLTVGGGEPLGQGAFVAELIKEAHYMNINTAIETSSCGSWEHLEKIIKNLNQMFTDIKHMDPAVHKKLTGVTNKLTLENIRKAAAVIADAEKTLTIRIPVIPGMNDSEENIRKTAEFAKEIGGVDMVELLPYHSFGEPKYARTKWTGNYTLHGMEPPSDEQMKHLRDIVGETGLAVKIGG